jgi:heme o synthase
MASFRPYFTLCRAYLSLFSACSAAAGFLLVPGRRVLPALAATASVFLLACGASALNQWQERDRDAAMERTRRRPLPSGELSPSAALALAVLLAFAGLLALSLSGGLAAAVLGVLALAWYNGVYTYLKRVTAFATVPGALVGMAPPAIGWVSAGGRISDPRLAAVCFLFFLWQVPHFWLLLLRHGEEYERAGLPSLTGKMSKPQIARITFSWISAAAVATLILPLFGPARAPAVYFSLVLLAVWLVWSGRTLMGRHPDGFPAPLLFRKINVYLFLAMSLLVLENLWFGAL